MFPVGLGPILEDLHHQGSKLEVTNVFPIAKKGRKKYGGVTPSNINVLWTVYQVDPYRYFFEMSFMWVKCTHFCSKVSAVTVVVEGFQTKKCKLAVSFSVFTMFQVIVVYTVKTEEEFIVEQVQRPYKNLQKD